MNPVDPLAALRPIHLPPEIGWWPPAAGWWILAALLLASLGAALMHIRRKRHANRYRRAALVELDSLFTRFGNEQDHAWFAGQCNQLLRRAALHRYPPAEVAPLSGARWLEFLDRTGRTDAFTRGAGQVLASVPYAPAISCDAPALRAVCADWLRQHG